MGDAPTVEVAADAATERLQLDADSWVDVTRGYLQGADELYDLLVDAVPWRQGRVFRYERYIDEPRMGSWYSRDQPYPHAALTAAHRAIQQRYRVTFGGVGLAYYRDGRDSVAPHRDTDLRYCENTVIAILTIGARRPWLLQPRGGRDRFDAATPTGTIDLSPAGGDLIVLGGACQLHWLHAVPKVRTVKPLGRISAQWRWTSKTGRPESQPSYRAARHFTR